MIARANGQKTVPQIFIGGQQVGGFDELQALEDRGELDALLGREKAVQGGVEHRRLIIIGSGPAGYTAAVYAARAELEPLVLAGLQFGGQLMLTTDVENYPGFPEGVTGPAMMELFQKQAERFGSQVLMEDAIELDVSERPFTVKTASKTYTADALVIATGASARWLGIESEQRLLNRGVSACATCDGALFRGHPLAVVGGGDTALEEALFLTRFATKVTLIHRRDELRASRIMQDRARGNEKIEFAWNSVVDEILGDEAVTGVRLEDVNTGESREIPVEAVFIAIGHKPNTEFLQGQITLDDVGYVKLEPGTTRTNVEGVFACGDAADPVYRQAVTAAGTGCMAAIDAERWLAEQGIG
ncbi:MAG: thioredoxin-disulfide reductase [Deltaproteobacteria bacterium]|nr:thioredoxin-disulfide reductase [Deltaproteobacteria bacterium]MBW2362985.1 thioredoxin-disulfide reductase [Deltaproteobacteria bacterium]